MDLHELLEEQINDLLPAELIESQVFCQFLKAVSATYNKYIPDQSVLESVASSPCADNSRTRILNMNLGMVELDESLNITLVNQRFCEMSGYEKEELIGQPVSGKLFTENHDELVHLKIDDRKCGVSDAYEVAVKNKKEELRWWHISGSPKHNSDGTIIGSSAIFLDITSQKLLQAELLNAKRKAEESSRLKEHFLANMSHEIRTPMNAIMGMSNLLGKTVLDSKQLFFLENINTASENLLMIINDILDFSKIEAGKTTLEIIGFEVVPLLNRAIQAVSHKAREKHLSISVAKYDDRIEPVLMGDPYRLNQVILNLLSNAIKFTQSGSVELSCQLVESGPTTQKISIQVKDTGVGMEANFIEHLFEKFSQEYESVTRLYGGSGLGMSICKELVSLMNGEIMVESVKGKGTTIMITVAFDKGSPADLPVKISEYVDASLLANKKIVVADDNEMNRLVVITMLENFGSVIFEAKNGEEVISIVSGNQVDLVLMDIQMPVINGLVATRLIRNELSASLPIIALTANAIKGEREKCLDAGMNDYLIKPFHEVDLVNIISRWLGDDRNSEPATENVFYDITRLVQTSRGNNGFVRKMLGLFIRQVPEAMSEIKTALAENDFERIYAVTHRIKPVFHSIGITVVKNNLEEIEALSLAEDNSSVLQELIVKLDETVSGIVSEVAKRLEDFNGNE